MPKFKIPRATKLSKSDAVVERVFEHDIQEHGLDEMERRYDALPDAQGGRVLNTDIARELSEHYREDRTRSAAVHEPASWLVKQLYARKLARLPPDSQVVFTAGGTGVGKSTAVKGRLNDAPLIYDTNMSGLESSDKKIKQALDAGHNASVLYVDRHPEKAFDNMLERAEKRGRTVPLGEHIKTHTESRATLHALAGKYAGDKRVDVQVIDNNGGIEDIKPSSVDKVYKGAYPRLEEKLNGRLRQAHAAGTISDAIAKGVGGEAYRYQPSGRRAQGAIAAGAVGAGALAAPDDAEARKLSPTQLAKQAFKQSPESGLLIPDELQYFDAARADSIGKFHALREALPPVTEMAVVAQAGQAKRGWYKQSMKAILQAFGPEDAPRFTALLAALSPQTSVETNLMNAVNMWSNWDQAGRPTDPKTIKKIMGRSVQGSGNESSVLNAWSNNSIRALRNPDAHNILISGPKVNSFMRNLNGVMQEVTNDTWMARYAGMDQDIFAGGKLKDRTEPVFGKPIGGKDWSYIAANSRARETAKHLTKLTGEEWTPAEVQETVWSYAKTLTEMQNKRSAKYPAGRDMPATQLLDQVTDAHVNATPAFDSLLTQEEYSKPLRKIGMGKVLDELGPPASETVPRTTFAQDAYLKNPDELRAAAKRFEQYRGKDLEDHSTGFVDPATLGALAATGTAGVMAQRGLGDVGQTNDAPFPRLRSAVGLTTQMAGPMLGDVSRLASMLSPLARGQSADTMLQQANTARDAVSAAVPSYNPTDPGAQAATQDVGNAFEKLSKTLGDVNTSARGTIPGYAPISDAMMRTWKKLPPLPRATLESIYNLQPWLP